MVGELSQSVINNMSNNLESLGSIYTHKYTNNMSREIKFRVWNKAKNDWEFGYKTMGGVNLFGEVHVMGYFNIPLQELNNYEAMQYTGLKDKNGKEIYEGDIVKCVTELPEPRYWNKVVEYESFRFSPFHTFLPKRVEIIGNIYENSELIKK